MVSFRVHARVLTRVGALLGLLEPDSDVAILRGSGRPPTSTRRSTDRNRRAIAHSSFGPGALASPLHKVRSQYITAAHRPRTRKGDACFYETIQLDIDSD